MLDWNKLHEMNDLKEAGKIIEKEGTEEEFTAFRCAAYLLDKPNGWVLLYAGMNFTNMDKAMDNIPDKGIKVAEYLSLSMTKEQLDNLEALLVTVTILHKM